jgi:hypothetical protein
MTVAAVVSGVDIISEQGGGEETFNKEARTREGQAGPDLAAVPDRCPRCRLHEEGPCIRRRKMPGKGGYWACVVCVVCVRACVCVVCVSAVSCVRVMCFARAVASVVSTCRRTDLYAHRRKVGEAAEGVGGDDLRPLADGLLIHHLPQVQVGHKLVEHCRCRPKETRSSSPTGVGRVAP